MFATIEHGAYLILEDKTIIKRDESNKIIGYLQPFTMKLKYSKDYRIRVATSPNHLNFNNKFIKIIT